MSLNILNTTGDGQQQILLSSVTPILANSSADPGGGGGIIFNTVGSKIIVQDHENHLPNSGVEYTLIEDPSGSGGYLQISNAAAENLVLSQEDLYEVFNEVPLPNETFPTSTATNINQDDEVEKKKIFSKRFPELEKPLGKGPFPCKICPQGALFDTVGKYKKHIKSHEDDRRFKCKECPSTFNLEKNLRLHFATHDPVDLICPECNRAFSRLASFKSHLTIHEEEDNLPCQQCDAYLPTEFKLRQHVESDHQFDMVETKPILDTILEETEVVSMAEEASFSSGIRNSTKLTCRLCQAQMKNSAEYKTHMAHHTKLKSLLKLKQRKTKMTERKGKFFKNSCGTCGKKFKKPSQLIRHERIHTGDKPFACSLCDKKFNQKNSLDQHARKHTGEKPYKCEFCQMNFAQAGNLRAHVRRVHSLEGDEPLLRCDECPCTFKKIGSLNAHVSRVHTKGILEEEKEIMGNQGANSATEEKEDLLFKALNSTGLPSNQPIRRSQTKRELQGRVRIKDNVNNKKHLVGFSRTQDGSKVYLCNWCPKDFKRPSDLCRHMRIHAVDRPFKCQFCPSAFSLKVTLATHLKRHDINPRNHICRICLRRFESDKALTLHKQTHLQDGDSKPLVKKADLLEDIDLGDPFIITPHGMVKIEPRHLSVYHPTRLESLQRKYPCTSCGASFKKSSHLKEHTLRHTGVKPFKCQHCDRDFVTRGSLNGHIRTHLMDQIFQCSFCPMTFTTKGSAKRHMATSHRKERPFVCPFCQKTFKTNALCRKHMKIHKKSLASTVYVGPNNEDQNGATASGVVTNTGPNLSTIETRDLSQRENLTLFTADSSGTVTLPTHTHTFGGTPAQTTHQGDLLANIGTITLQQGDQLTSVDLSDLQFASNNLIIKQDIRTVQDSNEQPKLCLDCNEVIEDNHQCFLNHNKKHDIFFCSYKKCGSSFESPELLADHMNNYHQPPFSFKPKTKSHEAIEQINTQSQQHSLTKMDHEMEPETLSEKLLRDSMKERDRISSLKTTLPIPEHNNKCEQCTKSFKKPSDLIRHRRVHTKEKPYKCDDCGKAFSVQSTLNTHKKIHLRISKLEAPDLVRCHICNNPFLSKTSLKAHMRIHTGAKPYECPNCGEFFRTSGARKNHVTMAHPKEEDEQEVQNVMQDLVENPQVVPIQSIPTIEQKTTAVPISIPISADVINQALEALTAQGKPILGATVKVQFGGNDTTLSLTVDERLLAQLSAGHNINLQFTTFAPAENVIEEPPPNQQSTSTMQNSAPLMCHLCDAVFMVEDDRYNHLITAHDIKFPEAPPPKLMESNNEIKQFDAGLADPEKICEYCNKVFAKPSMLIRHKRIHTGEKPFNCNLCNRSFNQKNALQIHIQKHTGDRPYTCPFCQFSFTQKGNLKTHIQRSHHDQAAQAKLHLASQSVFGP